MVLPAPRSQEADAGGLGLDALSICADPSMAIIPTVRHPTARNATVLFMVSSPRKLISNIEADLPFPRNCNCPALIDAFQFNMFRPGCYFAIPEPFAGLSLTSLYRRKKVMLA